MKPFKSGAIIAAWLLRIMLVWFIYKNYFHLFSDFNFKDFSFYLGAAYILFGLMIFAGGFMQKPALTVISGLAIFIIPIVQLIRAFPDDLDNALLLYLIPLSVGFYFFTGGNNN
jgi:uncharacterized membrane protein YkgB